MLPPLSHRRILVTPTNVTRQSALQRQAHSRHAGSGSTRVATGGHRSDMKARN